LTVVTAVLVLGAGAIAAAFLFTRTEAFATAETSNYAGQPTLGDADAPVKLILFENFMCEHCREFETDVFPQLKRDYIDTGRVEVYYVNLAWGSEQAELGGLAGRVRLQSERDRLLDLQAASLRAAGELAERSRPRHLSQYYSRTGQRALEACIAQGETRSELERDLAQVSMSA
jgi:hypothetical protein